MVLQSLSLTSWPGINTGLGGSADTRTKASDKLKEDLLSILHYGILAETTASQGCLDHDKDSQETDLVKPVLRLTHESATVMLESWIRAYLGQAQLFGAWCVWDHSTYDRGPSTSP